MNNRIIEIFQQICTIPHGSGNEQKLVEYIKEFSIRNNLDFRQDSAGNAVVCKNQNKESDQLTVILQAHLDMVCEKIPSKEHDFLTQGIEMYVKDGVIKANGTTLGADNGIGVAMILAALESDITSNSKIAGLFTVCEEIGMIGAINMDPTLVSGDILISLDYGGGGRFCIGSAGGNKIQACSKIQYEKLANPMKGYYLLVDGLKGGHSGLDIGEGRVNAIKFIIEFLQKILFKFPGQLNVCEFDLSGKGGVIPTKAGIYITFNDDLEHDVRQMIKQIVDFECKEQSMFEPNLNIRLLPSNKVFDKKFSKHTLEQIINTIREIPQGVISKDSNCPEIIEVSQNIDSITIKKDIIKLLLSQRTFEAEQLEGVVTDTKNILKKYGFSPHNVNSYSGWRLKGGNKIIDLFLDEYRKMYNTDAFAEIVHAGLECGVLSEKLGITNAIATGVSCFDIHTVNEAVPISNINNAYAFLKHMVKKLEQISRDQIM